MKESDDDLLCLRPPRWGLTFATLMLAYAATRACGACCHKLKQVMHDQPHKQKTRLEAGFFVCKESDDDLLSHG